MKTTDGSNLSKTSEVHIMDPKVLYTTHVQNVEWQGVVKEKEN